MDYCYIHLIVLCKPLHKRFDMTVVYAPNELAERLLLWDRLSALKQDVSGQWLLLGDFNNVLDITERIGGLAPSSAEILPFQQCVNDCEIEDM